MSVHVPKLGGLGELRWLVIVTRRVSHKERESAFSMNTHTRIYDDEISMSDIYTRDDVADVN